LYVSFLFQLEKGVDGLFDSFARLDSRISSVGQTAAKIGDHLQVEFSHASLPYAYDPCSQYNFITISIETLLFYVFIYMVFSCQSADAQRETASQTIELIKVLSIDH
jgi:hypothetical protein